MTKTSHTQICGIALNFEGAVVPDWVQLTPPAPELVGRDGRRWSMSDPAAVVARFAAAKLDLPIDIEHATALAKTGEAAPAVGWIEELAVRDGAIWGRVKWEAAGAALMSARGYRYLSPAFVFTKSGEIVAMMSAGLVHRPNFEMQALNSQQEMTDMDPAVLEALGLKPTGGAADAVLAINKLKTDAATALNSAKTPDPALFVPKADHEIALNSIKEFTRADEDRAELAMNAAVDAAVAAGKIAPAPASKEFYLGACKAAGLEAFQKSVEQMPVIAGIKPATTTALNNTGTATGKLSDEEVAVCSALGMTHDDFIKTKNEG